VLTTLARAGGQFGDLVAQGVTPVPLFLLAAAILYGIWAPFAASRAVTAPDR
jgi:hypothetical protein